MRPFVLLQEFTFLKKGKNIFTKVFYPDIYKPFLKYQVQNKYRWYITKSCLYPHAVENAFSSDDILVFLKSERGHVHIPETQDIRMHFTPTKKEKNS